MANFHVTHPPPRGSLPTNLSLREGCAASRAVPRPAARPRMGSAALSRLEDALQRVSPTLLYAALASLVVALSTVLVLEFPAFGRVALLDLIALEDPLFHAVIRSWYYVAPAAVTFAASLLLGDLVARVFQRGGHVALGRVHDAGVAGLERLERVLSWRVVISLVAGLAAYGWAARSLPFPRLGENPILDLIALEDPLAYYTIRLWCLAVPGLATFGGGLMISGSWRVWVESRRQSRRGGRGTLPPWPADPDDGELRLVLGEVHHPTEPKEVVSPEWLTLPERGLFTGIAIFGAVGSGKTSACMHPYARQLFGWRADDPERRAAGLVLEVKGDFCHDVRRMLEDAGRGDDYMELSLGGAWQWNPLDTDMDSYSLAYTVASLLSQLFGKGKEPFWQQAYTNLLRWTIELHRMRPGGWVTLRDLYRSAIDQTYFEERLEEAKEAVGLGEAPRIITVPGAGAGCVLLGGSRALAAPLGAGRQWTSSRPPTTRPSSTVSSSSASSPRPRRRPGRPRVIGRPPSRPSSDGSATTGSRSISSSGRRSSRP